MLHSMGHIGGLDKVLNDNCGLPVGLIFQGRTFLHRIRRKRPVPSIIPKFLQRLIHNVSRQNRIDYQLSESSQIVRSCVDCLAKTLELVLH